MYIQDKWIFNDSVEYEIKYHGRYGAKGEKRNKKLKATPEQIKKQNQKNREKKMRRLLKANFSPGDMWITLKYPKGTRKEVGEVKTDIKKFLDALRRRYKKEGSELKFIYRMEIGKQGGIHIHMVIPRIRSSDLIVQKLWKHGRVNYVSLDDGDYKDLAEYIVKQPDEDVEEQLTLFEMNDRKEFIKYSSSRNLIRPTPERKVYSRRTVKKLLEEGPKPNVGFYIDKDTIVMGTNHVTGMNFIYYTERRCSSG